MSHSVQLAPNTGFIGDNKTWKTLWNAWRPQDDVPTVDFGQKLILLGIVSGRNRVILNLNTNDRGEVKFVAGGTRMDGPGFGYKFVAIERNGIKSVNGNPIESGRSSVQDSINVHVVGTVRTGVAAIGGETTGTTITANEITWELDLGDNEAFRNLARKLNEKGAMVRGTLTR